MDRNFHINDFERLLREKSDEFRMYPSKRVWHSLYNNIHPGRKWPSVAMSITLISALLLMGYLNTKNANPYDVSGNSITRQIIVAEIKTPQLASETPGNYSGKLNGIPALVADNRENASAGNNPGASNKINSNNLASKSSPRAAGGIQHQLPNNDIPDVAHSNVPAIYPINKDAGNQLFTRINPLAEMSDVQTETAGGHKITPGIENDQSGFLNHLQKTTISGFIAIIPVSNFAIRQKIEKVTAPTGGVNQAIDKNNPVVSKNDFISVEEKDWIENYALYNRPAARKWANKLAWQMYATPSVVYRRLYSDPNFGNAVNTTPSALSSSILDVNKAVNQKPSVGFEIGTGFQYSISKGIKLKAGLQLNYTRYNSEAFQNTHPVATKLTMHDYKSNMTYEVTRSTPYSNKNGLESAKLHNETFQLSLPLGADLKLIGNDKIQWNFGVTIQPTYVLGGKSYLISSDRRNYIKETSMLNRWNLNAGFETFISFSANGLTWQIGPQFRRQLFSTNNRQIAVEERLLNYGLKFGISKTLK